MKAFCPNCGTQNDGMPGGRVTCQACTASFELPREDFGVSAPAAPPPPVAQVTAPPPVTFQPPPIIPPGYAGPPAQGFGIGRADGGTTNPLAIVSLVLGILCCVPFSIGAIITGVIANKQITESNGAQKGQQLAYAGIGLGTLALLMNLLWVLKAIVAR